MVQFCPICDAVNPNGAKICYSCGRQFKAFEIKSEITRKSIPSVGVYYALSIFIPLAGIAIGIILNIKKSELQDDYLEKYYARIARNCILVSLFIFSMYILVLTIASIA